MEKKYGFIYLWFDKKHKKYYVGRHWGTETDGYICSNTNMRDNHRNRPEDFKRRTLEKVYTNKLDLVDREQHWLNFIKPNELKRKYYNGTREAHWRGVKDCPWDIYTEDEAIAVKEKLRQANKRQFEDPNQREMRRQKSLQLWADPEYRSRTTASNTGKKQPREQVKKRHQTIKERGHYDRWSKERTGKPLHTEETKKIIGRSSSDRMKERWRKFKSGETANL